MLRFSSLAAAILLLTAAPTAQPVALDPSFGSGGISPLRIGSTSSAYDLVVLPDDSMVIAGTSDGIAVAVGVDESGQMRGSFGAQGVARIPLNGARGVLTSISRIGSGHLLVSGFALNSSNKVTYSFVARLTASGALDPSFGSGGVTRVTGFSADPILLAGVEPLPNGQSIAYGSVLRTDAPAAPVSVRILPNGTLDPSYGVGGTASLDLAVTVNDGLRLADDRIILAGSQLVDGYGDAVLLGIRPDGSLDPTFGSEGIVRIPLSDDIDAFTYLAVDVEGRLIAGGFARHGTDAPAEAVAARVDLDGRPDYTFGGGGLAKNALPSRASTSAVMVRSGGRVLLAGVQGQPSRPFLSQFLGDGTPDASFGQGGMTTVDVRDGTVTLAAQLDSRGRIVLAGYALGTGTTTEMIALRLVESPPVATANGPAADGSMLSHAWSHPSTTVALRLMLDTPASLRVDVVDLLGRTVARLHEGPAPAGFQTLIAAERLPAGTYVARAIADDGRRATLPVIVVR
jgi:uncharacterized delta-60 repeat protein